MGTDTIAYGSTATTDYWSGVDPSLVYIVYYFPGTSGGPQIYSVDDTTIINLANQFYT